MKTSDCFPKWLQHSTNSYQRYTKFHFLPNLLNVVFILFFIIVIPVGKKWYSLWLICISLMANTIEYFSYAYSIREIALHTVFPDFNWVIWSFVSSGRDYLHIVDTSSLSDAQLVIICCHTMCCLFITGPFEAQKF